MESWNNEWGLGLSQREKVVGTRGLGGDSELEVWVTGLEARPDDRADQMNQIVFIAMRYALCDMGLSPCDLRFLR